jgi:hypothetical protein
MAQPTQNFLEIKKDTFIALDKIQKFVVLEQELPKLWILDIYLQGGQNVFLRLSQKAELDEAMAKLRPYVVV